MEGDGNCFFRAAWLIASLMRMHPFALEGDRGRPDLLEAGRIVGLMGRKRGRRGRKSEDVGAAAMRAAVAGFLGANKDEQVPTWMHRKKKNRRTWKEFAEAGGWLETNSCRSGVVILRTFEEHVENVAKAGVYGSTLELYALWAMGVRMVTVSGAKLDALTPEFEGDRLPFGDAHAIAYYCGSRHGKVLDHFDVLISEAMVKSFAAGL